MDRGRTLGWVRRPSLTLFRLPEVGDPDRSRVASAWQTGEARHKASQFIPSDAWAQLSRGLRHAFRPFRVADVEAVAAEQEAVGAWPEEDALHLARL